MDFYPDPDHTEMAAATADLLKQSFGAEKLREAMSFADVRDGVWKLLADQGLPGVLVAEGNGGLDLGWIATTLMLREIGRAAVPGPFVDTIAVAPALLRQLPGGDAADLAAQIAEGATIVGVTDPFGLVIDADAIDVVLVPEAGAVRALRAEPDLFSAVPTLDSATPLHRLVPGATGEELFRAEAPATALETAAAAGALGTAAMLTGVTARIIDMTREFIGQREQFGRVVGSFQAVQHALVDAALAAAFAVPVVDAAAWELDNNCETAGISVAHAKVAATRAGDLAGQTGLQLHGAIGYTYEYDLQHYLKRVMTLSSAWGSESYHRRSLRSAVIGTGAAV